MSDFLSATEYKGPGEINLIYRQADEIGRLRAERDASRAEAERLRAELEEMRGAMESIRSWRTRARRERDEEQARADRLEGEVARLVKERDDLARAALGSAAPLRPIAPVGFVYHFADGGTVTITPGR